MTITHEMNLLDKKLEAGLITEQERDKFQEELIKQHNDAREERIRKDRLYSFYSSSY